MNDSRTTHTWPQTARLTDNKADVLRAFFHLAGQIEGRGEHEVWICLSNFIFGVESLQVHLCRCNGLLSSRHTFAKLDEF